MTAAGNTAAMPLTTVAPVPGPRPQSVGAEKTRSNTEAPELNARSDFYLSFWTLRHFCEQCPIFDSSALFCAAAPFALNLPLYRPEPAPPSMRSPPPSPICIRPLLDHLRFTISYLRPNLAQHILVGVLRETADLNIILLVFANMLSLLTRNLSR